MVLVSQIEITLSLGFGISLIVKFFPFQFCNLKVPPFMHLKNIIRKSKWTTTLLKTILVRILDATWHQTSLFVTVFFGLQLEWL